MDSSAVIGRLRASKLFHGLNEGWLARLASESRLVRFGDNEYLWRAGSEATHFTIIQHGLVQVLQPTPGGEDSLLALFGPRESVGDTAVMERGVYPADAVTASETVEVLRVRAEPVLAALPREAELSQALNRALLDHTRALRAKITVMSAGTVSQRVATLLLHLADRFGDEDDKGHLWIPVPLSRGALSRLVGARVETVIRTVSRWQKDKLVTTTKDGFEIESLEKLEALARGAG